MIPKRILAIDDDLELTALLTEYLGRHGIEIQAAKDGDAGLHALRRSAPDLVILDVMMPSRSGFEVCREIRKESAVPIIMLTARGDVDDRITGLELGADDYLPKPFDPRELLMRVQSVWRRGTHVPSGGAASFGDLRIDFGRRTAELAGEPLGLSGAEYEVLALLAESPHTTFDREKISARLHGCGWDVYSRSVDIVVSRLRQKLRDDPKRPRFFKTVWGTGYVFIAARTDGGNS